jgi:hypothetical protein
MCAATSTTSTTSRAHTTTRLGTDLGGFITPMLTGLEDASRLGDPGLVDRYGLRVAEQVCSGNALRVLHTGWRAANGGSHRLPGRP